MSRLALLFASLCLCACTTPSKWQTYDQTSYSAVMTPSDAVLEKHLAALESWTTGPAADVPPGIYAELGYWLAKVGRTEEARVMFEREMERYPYAQKYVRMLMDLVLSTTGGEKKSGAESPPKSAPPSTEKPKP
jgi:hypothetical protein